MKKLYYFCPKCKSIHDTEEIYEFLDEAVEVPEYCFDFTVVQDGKELDIILLYHQDEHEAFWLIQFENDEDKESPTFTSRDEAMDYLMTIGIECVPIITNHNSDW